MNVVRSLSPAAQTRDAAPLTRSVFPADAHALIYEPAPSVLTSAPRRKQEWKLKFERRSPLRTEPLMGWTEDDDPLTQVELSFPSVEAAIAYARRQGLQYTVLGSLTYEPQVRLATNSDRPARPRPARPRRGELEWIARIYRAEAVLSNRRRAWLADPQHSTTPYPVMGNDRRVAA
ncbi:NADH dehydrogenase ubiquinone Fe-S protein 4 [Bradyrhizobium liaoningense]|uniref:NADH dehydrogenase ubiquinone Fe-S protein 4 n=1 Tax=Bradyrhizobium liaoningense TaxID=43992 RepID=UPI001BA80AC6|nr:NADH dehydrogenase ubiquinone Fe-S protein 4 [Bradyrhizobium liaoningense]MBR0707964.1 ETC complex I subunit [Bradyrhizobium liaoningense]